MATSKKVDPKVAVMLVRLREETGRSRLALSRDLGVAKTSVSNWELGLNEPSAETCIQLAELGKGEVRDYFLARVGRKAGLTSAHLRNIAGATVAEKERRVERAAAGFSLGRVRTVPVLADAAAAGTSRLIEEGKYAAHMCVPKDWVSVNGELYGVPIEGDSMSPFLEDGYTALVDMDDRSKEEYVGKMVLAQDFEGAVTVKWFRHQEPNMYLLVPQNTSPRHPVIVVDEAARWRILGEVKGWYGVPPPPPHPATPTRKR